MIKDTQKRLKNYRTNAVRISIGESTGMAEDELLELKHEKIRLDTAINFLEEKHLIVVDMHFRKGLSYSVIAKRLGYTKAGI